jgi:hypothetical protein
MFLSDEAYVKFTMQERKGMLIFIGLIVISRLFNLSIFRFIIYPVSIAYQGIMWFMQLILGL